MSYKPSTSTIPVQESRHTFYIDGSITSASVGKACTLVLGGTEATIKLAGDGDAIFGQITTVEIPITRMIVQWLWLQLWVVIVLLVTQQQAS